MLCGYKFYGVKLCIKNYTMTENVNPLTNSVKCLASPLVIEMPPVVCQAGLYNKYDVMNKNEIYYG
jgi:hypothetical protein